MLNLRHQRLYLPLPALIARLTEACFALFIVLSLITPSWRYGPFSWWPLWHVPLLAGAPMAVGLFNGLPLLVLIGWGSVRVLGIHGRGRQWSFPSHAAVLLPLLGLTLLGLFSLEPALTRRTFIQAGGLAIFWLVYLFVVNERPNLTWPLALITTVQGSVAIAQFVWQKDLGLVVLGELPLNPAFEGITVLYARGQPWLRAYGLTAHPNLLGALLVMLLLWLLPSISRATGWRQVGLLVAVSLGSLGLFVSFSRAAWLALAIALLIWLILRWRRQRFLPAHEHPLDNEKRGRRPLDKRLLLLLPLLLLLWLNYDLVLSRFTSLDTLVEARSLQERLYDYRLSLQVIASHPWTGVGLGNYTDFARLLDPNANRVHNVPLLVTAELGLPGTLLWLWLMAAPFALLSSRALTASPYSIIPWVAMIIINLFDTMLWWSSNWQTAVLFALLVAQLQVDMYDGTSG